MIKQSMKYLLAPLTSLTLLLLSCSQYEEPSVHEKSQLDQPKSVEATHYGFIGTYVTEDLQDGIEIFDNNSFAYKPNCNKWYNEWRTWRIGKWNYNDTINGYYEDGGVCQMYYSDDTITYVEDSIYKYFLRSTDYTITVGKNPNFDGDHSKEQP